MKFKFISGPLRFVVGYLRIGLQVNANVVLLLFKASQEPAALALVFFPSVAARLSRKRK